MAFFKPTYLIDGDLTDVDLEKLQADGIRGLILDLDSTLMSPKAGMMTEAASTWLQQARANFKLAIVSNNKNEIYMEKVRVLLDMPVLHTARKPSIKMFIQVLDQLQLKASDCAVIGDRPLTDIWGGQRAGMKTILVFPLKHQREPSWKTFCRKLERCFIKS